MTFFHSTLCSFNRDSKLNNLVIKLSIKKNFPLSINNKSSITTYKKDSFDEGVKNKYCAILSTPLGTTFFVQKTLDIKNIINLLCMLKILMHELKTFNHCTIPNIYSQNDYKQIILHKDQCKCYDFNRYMKLWDYYKNIDIIQKPVPNNSCLYE